MPAARDQLLRSPADRHRFDWELGRGVMAAGFLAQDRNQDRPVALEVLHAPLAVR